MNPNPKLIKLIAKLQANVEHLRTRVPESGPIAGWTGFHIELDEIDALTNRLRLGARGVFEEDGPLETNDVGA